jgi:hypothetical protein
VLLTTAQLHQARSDMQPTSASTPYNKRTERSDRKEDPKRRRTEADEPQHGDASEPAARLDTPFPGSTNLPTTELPPTAALAVAHADGLDVAHRTADDDVEMRMVTEQDDAGRADSDMSASRDQVPLETQIFRLPPHAEHVTAPGEIISINTHPWDLAWITSSFKLVVQPGNALSVETDKVLKSRALPMFRLALVNKPTHKEYEKELSAMRWTFQLNAERGKAYGYLAQPSIEVLLDTDAYTPNLPQAPSHHTLVLMMAGGQHLPSLYRQLSRRASGQGPKPQHMDLARLPMYAVLAACLVLDQNGEKFACVLKEIQETLPTFTPQVQAQVHLHLCTFFLSSDKNLCAYHEQALEKLGALAAEELEKFNRFKAVAAPFTAKQGVKLELVGDLFGALPAAGEPWNLMALAEMQILSGLHKEENVLMPAQIQVFVKKTLEMVRYFMSLEAPNTLHHPINAVIKHLFNQLSLLDAFMQLSPYEQSRFLGVLQTGVACTFTEGLLRRVSPSEIMHLCNAIQNLKDGLPFNVGPLLQEWLFKTRPG